MVLSATASSVVAVPEVLGLTSVETLAMQNSITHGSMGSRPAKVSWFPSKYKCNCGYNGEYDEWYNMSVNIFTNACVSAPLITTTPRIETTVGSACPKCGTLKKSGKRSCCAPGGTWFQNCGDGSNSNVDHTWFEGIQACVDLEAKTQAMLDREANKLNQNVDSSDGAVHTNFRGYYELMNVGVTISFLFFVLNMEL